MPQSLYRVTIAGVTGTAPQDGFIDNTVTDAYIAAGGTAPTTYAQTQAKARAFARFRYLQQNIQLEANVYLTDIVAAGGSATTAPSSFVFTAVVERGDGVLFTRDELNGDAPLVGVEALKRWIARGLIVNRIFNTTIKDPSLVAAPGNTMTYARRGYRTELLTVGAIAANLTTATALINVGVV